MKKGKCYNYERDKRSDADCREYLFAGLESEKMPRVEGFMIIDDDTDIDEFNLEGLRFKRTCSACPEQYDVFFKGALVAYIRLRYGGFEVYSPNLECGTLVYAAKFANEYKGVFKDSVERAEYLTRAAHNINNYISRNLQKIASDLLEKAAKERRSPNIFTADVLGTGQGEDK